MVDHSPEPRFAGYLQTNRAFMAPAVERAVGSLDLTNATRLLDAGTGAGGALAATHTEQVGVSSRVRQRAGDVREVLAESGAAPRNEDSR